jgi:hypothetical protein
MQPPETSFMIDDENPAPLGAELLEELYDSRQSKRENWDFQAPEERAESFGDVHQNEERAPAKRETAPFQFLHVNEPFLPPDKRHRHAVRTHVMRDFHSKRRKDKSGAIREPKKLCKKGSQDSDLNSPSHLSVEVDATKKSTSEKIPKRNKVSPCQTFAHVTPNSDKVWLSNVISGSQAEIDAAATGNFLDQFDRWLFNTSEFETIHHPHSKTSG